MERHGPPESGPLDATLLFLWNPTGAFPLAGDGSFLKFLDFFVRAVDFDMENEKGSFIFLAKLAEKAERYDEMVENMKKVAKLDVELIAEERNLLSVGYKKVVGARRTSWRIMSLIEQKQESSSNEQRVELIQSYRQKVEEELVQICDEILAIIDQHLIPSSRSIEPTIFYHKMKGDYSRYLAEFKTGEEKQKAADQSMKAYEIAYEKAKIDLPPTHPIRLGLALNFSVLYYEILNSPDRACYLAKQAFDLAIAEQDNSSEEPHEDSALIIQLLRDNLQLWTSKLPPEDEETRLYCNSLGYYNADNEIEES